MHPSAKFRTLASRVISPHWLFATPQGPPRFPFLAREALLFVRSTSGVLLQFDRWRRRWRAAGHRNRLSGQALEPAVRKADVRRTTRASALAEEEQHRRHQLRATVQASSHLRFYIAGSGVGKNAGQDERHPSRIASMEKPIDASNEPNLFGVGQHSAERHTDVLPHNSNQFVWKKFAAE